jgi:hypothetical protein
VRTAPLFVAVIILLVALIARTRTGAYTATSAPPYYQFTFSPAAVAANVMQYADRSMTIFAIAIVVWALAVGVRPSLRRIDHELRRRGTIGASFELTKNRVRRVQ